MAAPRRGERAEDLRRRLYRADATEADLRQYLAARGEPAAAPPPPPVPREHRGGRRALAGAVALALVASAGGTALLLHRPSAISAPATTTSGTGPSGTAAPAPTNPVTRASPGPILIDGQPASAERFEGIGDGVVPVRLPGAEFGTQRAVLLVYSDRTSTISWRALRATGTGDPGRTAVAAGRITSHVDDADPVLFTYAGAPPGVLAIEAPAGLHWTLFVAAAGVPMSSLR